MSVLLRAITSRTLDTVAETGQEDLQELVTIAGTQLGSKIDTGEWVYSFSDMVKRLWDTTKESLRTFGLTNIPSVVNNVGTQNNKFFVATGENVDLKPQALLDELMNSGEKCNLDEVIVVTKTTDGMLLWLEQGNTKTGLTHIQGRHSGDFASQGVDDIPQLINEILKTDPIQKGQNQKGLYADYVLNGNTYRLAYGTNGYIVSFYPID